MPDEHALARDPRATACRCATASATRSIRSTTITASAVSEAIVAPVDAHRDADVGERERRRVVDPVADHHHRRQLRARLHRADDLELLLGRLLGDRRARSRACEPISSATAGAVAGHHRDVDDPGAPQLVGDAVRRPRAGGRRRRSPRRGRRRRPRAPRATVVDASGAPVTPRPLVAALREPARAADRDAAPVDDALDALARAAPRRGRGG